MLFNLLKQDLQLFLLTSELNQRQFLDVDNMDSGCSLLTDLKDPRPKPESAYYLANQLLHPPAVKNASVANKCLAAMFLKQNHVMYTYYPIWFRIAAQLSVLPYQSTEYKWLLCSQRIYPDKPGYLATLKFKNITKLIK